MRNVWLLLLAVVALATFLGSADFHRAPTAAAQSWSVTQTGTLVEIAYGSGSDFPQYAALHLESSYFRLNYGPGSGWGTSVILLPSFWAGGTYYQGAPITYTWQIDGADLVMSITGTISGLLVHEQVRLSPPGQNLICARVTADVEGNVAVDNRPGEAFKPVMLSSMHISADTWDAQSSYVDSQSFQIPESGWIVQPPATGRVFGLSGGTSAWKTNAPTVEIGLDETRQITGWATPSNNPNDDNVGFWVASDQVIPSWQYAVTAAVHSDSNGDTIPDSSAPDCDNDGFSNGVELYLPTDPLVACPTTGRHDGIDNDGDTVTDEPGEGANDEDPDAWPPDADDDQDADIGDVIIAFGGTILTSCV